MTRVRGKYPRAWRLATVTVVLFLVAAVSALFVVPTMVSGAGDPWADAVWHSYRVKDPTFAVGAPDSSYARLEYNGYLDLDLGDGEEVYDGPGDDLTVHGKGTSVYAVYAWDGGLWQSLGTGSAVSSFDLGAGGLASTRYVRILPWPSRIYLDAVEAGYVEPWNSPPQPSFTSPGEGEQLSEDCVPVEAEDLAGEGDIVGCDWWYYYDVDCNGFDDDGSTWTEMQECTLARSGVRILAAGDCGIVWDVSDLPDCCYIVGVQMEDDQAQVGNATRSVQLSKNNPEPEIVEPAWDEFTDCGNTTLGGVVTLSAVDGNTTDQGMDIDLGEGSSSVRFMYCYAGLDCDCDSGWSEIPGTVVQHEDAGRYWTLEWDTTQFSDCCHRVLVEMTDKHGLTGNSSEYCVGVGNHAPELVFVEPDECHSLGGNVTLRVEDVGFDVGEDITDDCVSFYYCNSTSNECPCGPDCAGTWVWIDDDCAPDGNMTWSVEWNTSGVEDCYHVVKANVTDNHGLEGNGTVCIGVANEPPQPQITSPTTGQVYSGNVTITVIDGLGAGDIARAGFFYWYDGNCTSYGNCTDPGPDSEEWVYIGEDNEPGDGMSVIWDTSGLPDCCYVVAAVVFDVHEQGDYDAVCIELANRSPEPEIVDPPDGCFENDAVSGVVTITAADFGFDDGADIDIVDNVTGNCSVGFSYCYAGLDCDCDNGWTQIPGPVAQHDGVDGRYWTVSWNTTGLDDCCYRLRAEITDMHDLTGDGYACVGVNYDNPAAHITEPCESGNVTECNDCLISGNVTVTVEETSGAEDLGWAEFFYYDDTDGNCTADDDNQWVYFATCSEPECNGNCTFTASFNTTSLELHDCCHILKAVVYDMHGGTGEDTMCIAVSNNAPEPVIDDPDECEEYCWDNWINLDCSVMQWIDPVELVAHDDSPEQGADITSCTFEVWDDFDQDCEADDGNSTWLEIGSASEEDGYWVYDWYTWTVPDECYLIRANMTDEHGRSGYSEWINVYVNWQRPAPYIREWIGGGGGDITHPDGEIVYCVDEFDLRVVDVCKSTDIEDMWAEYWDEDTRQWVEIGTGYYWQYSGGQYEWLIQGCQLPCPASPPEWVFVRVTAIDKYWQWYEWWWSQLWQLEVGRSGQTVQPYDVAGIGSTIIEVHVDD